MTLNLHFDLAHLRHSKRELPQKSPWKNLFYALSQTYFSVFNFVVGLWLVKYHGNEETTYLGDSVCRLVGM